jgi:hypothetical protein
MLPFQQQKHVKVIRALYSGGTKFKSPGLEKAILGL